MTRLYTFLVLLFSLSVTSQVVSERERALIVDEILEDRFNTLLPELMDRAVIDMWVLISREYNEDPVLKTMLPATWLNARRRTILVFYRDQEKNTIENTGDSQTLNIKRSLYFGNARDTVIAFANSKASKIDIRFSEGAIVDASGAEALKDIKALNPGATISFSGVSPKLKAAFSEMGVN